MSLTETVVASLPLRSHSPEVIDVDALEDHPMEITQLSGFQQASSGSRSTAHAAELAEEGFAFMGYSRSPRRPSARLGRSIASGGAQAGGSATAPSHNIIILESDDEEASPSSSIPRRSSANRSRLISPPPPPVQRGNTPAVPPLPLHLAPHRSHILRRRRLPIPPPPNPPVIRPSELPLPFEARMVALPHLPPRNLPSSLPAAPRSHHQPAMGFGGAIIALNRQNAAEEAHRQEQEARASTVHFPFFSDMYRRLQSYRTGSNVPEEAPNAGSGTRPWLRFWPSLFDDHDPDTGRNLSPFGEDDTWFHLPDDFGRRKAVEKVCHWRPEYTHPDPAGPGFTFDFAPSDDPSSQSSSASSPTVIVLDEDEAGPSTVGSSSSSATALETTLVCARCLDPLVLAAPDGSREEERKKYRVWALRCGHMLDGKCIAELMLPPAPAPVEELVEDVKGKSKARADPDHSVVQVEPITDGTSVKPADASVPGATPDRKGKRKAAELLESEPRKRPVLAESTLVLPTEEGSIRSRLRSHARLAVDLPNTLIATGPCPRRSHRHTHRSAAQGQEQRRSAKGKGKARAKGERKPVIEAEQEWTCPVAGCGRVHFSVRVEGEWRNDEGRGGIALFV